jgi:serine/tyrosine/threonine adenylyltransferase
MCRFCPEFERVAHRPHSRLASSLRSVNVPAPEGIKGIKGIKGIRTDLDSLPFDNAFTSTLPADPLTSNGRRQVQGAAFSRVAPTPVSAPTTLIWSAEVAKLLGLSAEVCSSSDFAAVFSGNRIPAGADPFAMCYGGHQFGNWAGQLGDGRAIAIGEITDTEGGHQTLQLKGPGPTPYSRTADGRAVLRSSIREFLCSEAMFHLGVPTTRALSLVATGDSVVRDMLYDGNRAPEPGAVVCRVAPSFVRFGSFQLPASRGDLDLLRQLVDFTIRRDYSHLLPESGVIDPNTIVEFFKEVCSRTVTLVVHWMRVGFVHGVLNTDNMSILGLTIDYGPYGWLENFDAGWTPNTTDASGKRYRYGAQPEVVHWNLVQLANALVGLIDDTAPLQAAIDQFSDMYTEQFRTMMAKRLGWGTHRGESDDHLTQQLWAVFRSTEIDQVIFYRRLAEVPVSADATDEELLAPLEAAWYLPDEVGGAVRDEIVAWVRAWAVRASSEGLSDDDRTAIMNATNPKYVLRNYLAQQIIDAATAGDLVPLHEMLEVLRHPYAEQPGREQLAAKRPEWARHRVGCSMLSCSS